LYHEHGVLEEGPKADLHVAACTTGARAVAIREISEKGSE
jgi:hypothetical protein